MTVSRVPLKRFPVPAWLLIALLLALALTACNLLAPQRQDAAQGQTAPTAAPASLAPTPARSGPASLGVPAANDPLPSWPASRPPTPQPPPPDTRQSATGNISVGQTVTVASTEVPPTGGQIEYARPGDPLNGLKVTVPANAYPDKRPFKVSYAPVTGATFKDFKAASPLITVDNGGGYSSEVMKLTVPVKLAPDEFAMGFLYDDKTGKLEGLPLLAMSASSVTVGTYHYSNVIIGIIESKLLKTDIDSGFRPGIDDWQFVNRGSYIAPGGHCAGQALTALWYYVNQPDGKDRTLYNRYDNNGLAPATPDIWEDDSRGYRFASVIQKDIDWDSFANTLFRNLTGLDDELTLKAFTYAAQVTGEPQYVGIRSSKGGGHAMIIYRIKDNQLYIADPNYSGNNDRRIEFVNGKFKPYNSGANKKEIDAGDGKPYETILYIAKTATVDWSLIARRWAEVKSGAIGNDRFPKYTLAYVDKGDNVQPLNDGAVISVNSVILGPREDGFGMKVYRDGQELKPDALGRYTLVPGENKLGFAIYGKVKVKQVVDGVAKEVDSWEYVDFRYVTVRYQAGDIQPPIARLPGNIYLGAYPYQKEAEMTHGLYLITPNDGKSRQISPRAIQGAAISPDGARLAAGMLAETGRGPGDPQLAIFDAKDPAYKSLRSVFEVRPGKGPDQLTNPTWARDSLTLAVSRTTDLHLYQYSTDKSKDKTSFWAVWEGSNPAWSPTDNRLVIVGTSGDGLYLVDDVMKGAFQFDAKYDIWSQQASQGFRSLRPSAVTKIAGAPSNARKPKWSPDGKNISYISDGALWTIPASGGSPARVSPEGWKIGAATYSPDASYIAVVRAEAPANGGVWVLKPNGSEPRQLVKADFSVYGGVDLAWGP